MFENENNENNENNNENKMNNKLELELELNKRKEYLNYFYNQINLQIFKSNEFTLLSPLLINSLIITDETISLTRYIFNNKIDYIIRYIALKLWFILLLLQLLCIPLGIYLLTIRNNINYINIYQYLNLLCLPGSLFPLILLLRSHWKIIYYMLKQWEPMFLTFYAILFCISNIVISNNVYNAIFLIFVFLPTLLSCIFGDASALRLDYAFIKGDISTAALALPPCIVSFIGIVAILLTNRDGLNGVDLSNYNIVSYIRSLLWTTGFTLCLFIGRSIVHIIITPQTCVSIRVPLVISTISLSMADNLNEIEGTQKMSCTLLLNGQFDYHNGDIHSSKTTISNPITDSHQSQLQSQSQCILSDDKV